jgi:cellulose synthase/poly-beta-1,6-N-acetylglucosamine synthase-like glycosyltransferase
MMLLWMLWTLVIVFLALQIPPLLGVLVFRTYVRRELELASNMRSLSGDHHRANPPLRRTRRGDPEDAKFFHLAGYWRNVLQQRGLSATLSALRRFPWRTFIGREQRQPRDPYTPKVTLILPCKGVDPGFEQNVRSILDQEYPDFEVLFVTATEDDAARIALKSILHNYPGRTVSLLVAGIRPDRSEKLNNQLCALASVRPDTEVFVFVDSDVRAHPEFLRSLVEPLNEAEIGATTGFRWYIPAKGGFGSYLRATWNMGGVPLLADGSLAYAWGGAMAIKRETFERAGIAQRWETALTDDFPLTDGVKTLRLAVHFVPQCLVVSREDSTLWQTVEWTNRQTIICRVYNPCLWRIIFTSYAVQALAFVAGVGFVTAAALAAVRVPWLALALLFCAIPAQGAFGLLLWRMVRTNLLPEIGGWRQAFKHAALVPAAILLIFFNSVFSLCTRVILWRGVRYRLLSTQRTEVLSQRIQTQA